MSIRFACKCGKHLRAGDTMAGRHTLCPKCGALVAIPSREDAAAGAALARPGPVATDTRTPPSTTPPADGDDAEDIGPILVRVRRRNERDPNRYRKSVWVPLDPERGPPPEKMPRPVRTARKRYDWKLETHWYQSLAYPFRAWRLLFGLALVQSALLVWAAVLIPKLQLGAEATSVLEPIVFALAAAMLTTYTFGLFDCVLSSASAGEYRVFRYPGIDLGAVGVARWVACFLAGPALPAAIGLAYWYHSGDPDLLDRIVLVELASVTCGYWLLEILASREAGAWFAGPAAVGKMFLQIGPRSLVVATGAPALAYAWMQIASAGLSRWHIDGFFGVPSLVAAGLALNFGATLLLRLFGVWHFRSSSPAPDNAEPSRKSTDEA